VSTIGGSVPGAGGTVTSVGGTITSVGGAVGGAVSGAVGGAGSAVGGVVGGVTGGSGGGTPPTGSTGGGGSAPSTGGSGSGGSSGATGGATGGGGQVKPGIPILPPAPGGSTTVGSGAGQSAGGGTASSVTNPAGGSPSTPGRGSSGAGGSSSTLSPAGISLAQAWGTTPHAYLLAADGAPLTSATSLASPISPVPAPMLAAAARAANDQGDDLLGFVSKHSLPGILIAIATMIVGFVAAGNAKAWAPKVAALRSALLERRSRPRTPVSEPGSAPVNGG
jgi:hypothetical protein